MVLTRFTDYSLVASFSGPRCSSKFAHACKLLCAEFVVARCPGFERFFISVQLKYGEQTGQAFVRGF